jgi:hypothetical protein
MKFTLTYDGPLPSSGSRPKALAKWEIRRHFHPQLEDLWSSHPALIDAKDNRYFPKTGGGVLRQGHHFFPGNVGAMVLYPGETLGDNFIDLIAPIEKHRAWFRPLVRDTLALHCGLKILFLRKERPGKVYQSGDIDGRIKTLLDALTMPQHVEQIEETTGSRAEPMLCLLEDDSLVSGLNVETERLLTGANFPNDYTRLVIEVDVRVRQATIYNQSFLG